MGGNPGERLCRNLNMKVSSSSLIRLIHKQKLNPVERVTVLGIGAGAPQAIQVGDRWHLLKNLDDALQKLLERNRQHLKYVRHKQVKPFTASIQAKGDQ